MVLTNARGGRRGHSRILCPLAPQYRHKPSESRLRLSADDRRLWSVCMGSGGSLISGWRMGGVAMATGQLDELFQSICVIVGGKMKAKAGIKPLSESCQEGRLIPAAGSRQGSELERVLMNRHRALSQLKQLLPYGRIPRRATEYFPEMG